MPKNNELKNVPKVVVKEAATVKVVSVCKDFLKNKCTRKNCKFLHEKVDAAVKPVEKLAQPKQAGAGNQNSVNKGPGPKIQMKKVVRDMDLIEFSYKLGDLPIEIHDDADVKECVGFCKAHSLHYIVKQVVGQPTNYHPVDGRCVRHAATKQCLAACMRLVCRRDKSVTVLKIRDLWGNNRTRSLLNKVAADAGDFGRFSSMYDYKCIGGVYDAKDLLRDNNSSYFTPLQIMDHLEGVHIALIQDVQQQTTSKYELFKIASKVAVLGVICHIERGPFGLSGYHGFYVRESDKIVCYPSKEDPPYYDTQDFGWVLESNQELYQNTIITWCVQPIYGNTVYVVFTRHYGEVHHGSLELPNPLKKATIEVTNRPMRWIKFKWVQDAWDLLNRQEGVYETSWYYEPIVMILQNHMKGRAQGIALTRSLDALASSEFAKIPGFVVMKEKRPELYAKLEAFTIAVADRRESESQLHKATLSTAAAGEYAEALRLRNLKASDKSFDRTFCIGCMLLPCAVCVKCSGCTLPQSQMFLPTITKDSLIESVWPSDQLQSIDRTGDLDCLEVPVGVTRMCVLVREKRAWTQTPLKGDGIRLGPEGSCEYEKLNPVTGKNYVFPFGANVIEHVDSAAFTYHYGPFNVPWHANRNSAGGALGMLNALLSEVELNNGSFATLEQSRDAWDIQGWDVGNHPPIDVSIQDKMLWCQDHIKKSVYVPALSEIINGTRVGPPTAYKLRLLPKTNELLLKNKERIIIAANPSFPAYWGAVEAEIGRRHKLFWSMENFWRNVHTDGKASVHAYWGAGTTPEERGLWYDESLTIPPNHASIIACGDDFLGMVNLDGVIYIVEADASNWDHSQISYQDKGALEQQYVRYQKFGAPEQYVHFLRSAGKDGILWKPGSDKYGVIVTKLGYGRRMSGLPDTTNGNTGNTIEMYRVILQKIINNWHDANDAANFIKTQMIHLANTLFAVKLKVKVPDIQRSATFLKGFFVECRCREGNYSERTRTIWYPSPEILVKLGVSESNPVNNPLYNTMFKNRKDKIDMCYHMRAYDIVNSWKTFSGLPVLTSIQKMIKAPIATTYEESRRRTLDSDKWDRPELNGQTHIVSQDWDPMLQELEIAEHLASFDELCSRTVWTPGMFVQHPLIATLAKRYR